MKKFLLCLLLVPSMAWGVIPDYDRGEFPHWRDLDQDCENTREEALKRDAHVVLWTNDRCTPVLGLWKGEYTGEWFFLAGSLDVDHVVTLKHAWYTGAWKWDKEKRRQFANDMENVIAVDASTNRSKGSKPPWEWLPTENQCEYISRFAGIKLKYGLEITDQEDKFYRQRFAGC